MHCPFRLLLARNIYKTLGCVSRALSSFRGNVGVYRFPRKYLKLAAYMSGNKYTLHDQPVEQKDIVFSHQRCSGFLQLLLEMQCTSQKVKLN